MLNTDKQCLQQVFLNLLLNAIENSRVNGKILVLVQLEKTEQNSKDRLLVSIKDNGFGI